VQATLVEAHPPLHHPSLWRECGLTNVLGIESCGRAEKTRYSMASFTLLACIFSGVLALPTISERLTNLEQQLNVQERGTATGEWGPCFKVGYNANWQEACLPNGGKAYPQKVGCSGGNRVLCLCADKACGTCSMTGAFCYASQDDCEAALNGDPEFPKCTV